MNIRFLIISITDDLNKDNIALVKTPKQATSRRGRSGSRPEQPRLTSEFLGFRLVKAALRIRGLTAAALKPCGLSPQDFGLLNQSVVEPGLTQSQLGGVLGIDRTTIVTMLDRLEKMGLVHRTADENDRRIYRIAATDKGRALNVQAVQLVSDVEQAFLEPLTTTQVLALQDALVVWSREGLAE